MKSRHLTALSLSAGLILASAGFSVAAMDGVQVPVRQAVQDFKKANPHASLYHTGPRVTSVYGAAFAFGDSAQQTADDFLSRHASLFGTTTTDLVPGTLASDGNHSREIMPNPQTGKAKFILKSFLQERDGIPVFRSDVRLLIRNEPGYPLVLARAATFDLGNFTVNQGVAAQPAFQAAKDQATMRFAGMLQFTQPELVIWAGYDDQPAQPRLALAFIGQAFTAKSPRYQKQLILADAQTGQILWNENQIHNADIVGTIKGMATPGEKADICDDEVLMPMPYAMARLGPTVVYADVNGNFTLPNPGTGIVPVQSEISGLWFRTYVSQTGGAQPEPQVKNVTPPGPVNFVFNQPNTVETHRSAVNAYISANKGRDFILKYVPDYPTLGSQIEFPVNVNVVGSCNAFYDGTSINFFASGDCPSTAYSDVVWHEYGHHMVACGGSGQGQYGEGMGDVVGVLISDDPVTGYGFEFDCSKGIRTAENTKLYPCQGEIHDCGQLISGCVWATRNELKKTDPTDYIDILSHLAFNSVLMHTGTMITPQITLDYLTLDDDDANLNNGTPHYLQIAKGFGQHGMDAPPLKYVNFTYPQGTPESIKPDKPYSFPLVISPNIGSPIPNTAKLFYKVGSGTYKSVALSQTSPNHYNVVLPATPCESVMNWYIEAQINPESQFMTDPFEAPTDFYTTYVAQKLIKTEPLFEHFTSGIPAGWTADGLWQVTSQCNPDPSCDGGAIAYYGINAGCSFNNGDRNTGSLFTPFLGITSDKTTLKFCYRYQGEDGDPYDYAAVRINGEVVYDASLETEVLFWKPVTIDLAPYVGTVIKIEFFFDSLDSQFNDFLGWQIDGVHVSSLEMDCNACYADCDGTGSLNIDDFVCFQTLYAINDPNADCDGNGQLNIDDFVCFQTSYALGC